MKLAREPDFLKTVWGNFGKLRFNENLLFITLISFITYWDYKPTIALHADRPGVYTSAKVLNLSRINNIPIKFVVTDGIVVNCSKQPILYSFFSAKPLGEKVYCDPETKYYKKQTNLF